MLSTCRNLLVCIGSSNSVVILRCRGSADKRWKRSFTFDASLRWLEKVSVVVNKHAGDSFLCVPEAAFCKQILELMPVKKFCRRAEIDQVMHVPRIQVKQLLLLYRTRCGRWSFGWVNFPARTQPGERWQYQASVPLPCPEPHNVPI